MFSVIHLIIHSISPTSVFQGILKRPLTKVPGLAEAGRVDPALAEGIRPWLSLLLFFVQKHDPFRYVGGLARICYAI